MDGARGAREKNLTFPRIVRVQCTTGISAGFKTLDQKLTASSSTAAIPKTRKASDTVSLFKPPIHHRLPFRVGDDPALAARQLVKLIGLFECVSMTV
jgi:hypothetical protein